MGGRRDDRKYQYEVRVGGVHEPASNGVNDAENGQKVERGVDGGPAPAGQELGGQPRPDAEHSQRAESVKHENLKIVFTTRFQFVFNFTTLSVSFPQFIVTKLRLRKLPKKKFQKCLEC